MANPDAFDLSVLTPDGLVPLERVSARVTLRGLRKLLADNTALSNSFRLFRKDPASSPDKPLAQEVVGDLASVCSCLPLLGSLEFSLIACESVVPPKSLILEAWDGAAADSIPAGKSWDEGGSEQDGDEEMGGEDGGWDDSEEAGAHDSETKVDYQHMHTDCETPGSGSTRNTPAAGARIPRKGRPSSDDGSIPPAPPQLTRQQSSYYSVLELVCTLVIELFVHACGRRWWWAVCLNQHTVARTRVFQTYRTS